ncbi:SNARE Sft1 [Schizosaccharomyces japonicus yFS275]|uniref:SNARE Sft1 n=1 Tax=Schizosaccharomyces japonicus (strain yFS275 / FY16936) TaxID=402676 RepID=B6JWM6_SCHJY|nr:SNARE Sft1 [Schizosaccharomyces japonicus yFS275]EEB05777.1 SNARE Sft1 [Schizosaccharomyces japonicus yFS275]
MNDHNEHRLKALSSQVSALKGVTIDIYNRASDYSRIDQASEGFAGLRVSVSNVAGRFARVVRTAGKRSILYMVLIIVSVVLLGYYSLKRYL